MQRKPSESSTSARLVEAHHRLALWAGIFLVVALLAGLGFSRSAQATPAPPASAFTGLPTAFVVEEAEEEESEAEEGQESVAECALEAQEEIAEGEPVETECEVEAEEEESEGGSEIAPEECFVRTTAATIAANPANNSVHLALRYTTWTPATVAVSYSLRGAKGGLALGHATKHFGKKGVLKLSTSLTDAEMVRAMAAHEFDVAVHAINSPGYCGKIFAQRLSAHKAVGKGRLWTNPRAG
jgi:hypothetical protein